MIGKDKKMENEGKVINFPSGKNVNPKVKIDDTAIRLHNDLKFAEHLTEGLTVNLIHNLGENEIDTQRPEFIRDIGFLVELIKSIIHRDMSVKHPMQELVDAFVTSEYDDEHGLYTNFDMQRLMTTIEKLKK